MMELITLAFSPVNIVFTILLLLMAVYWLMMILGALDLEFLDVDAGVDLDADLDVDVDVDVDADIDVDADVDVDYDLGVGPPELSFFQAFLQFFYLGRVPMMVLMSIFVLTMWSVSIIGNYLLNPWGSTALGWAIAGGNIVVSLLLLKAMGAPLARAFRPFYQEANQIKSATGKLGIVLTSRITSERIGQVEIRTHGAPLVVNAKTAGDDEVCKGDEAVVIEKDKTSDVYIVAPVDLEK